LTGQMFGLSFTLGRFTRCGIIVRRVDKRGGIKRGIKLLF
jgi:hypothetical protein